MKQCPRCQRYHSGLCGIPPGVTLGFGAHNIQKEEQNKGRMMNVRRRTMDRGVLDRLLKEARLKEEDIKDLLKVLPAELPEYDLCLDRLAKLESVIGQLNRQIINKRLGSKGE